MPGFMPGKLGRLLSALSAVAVMAVAGADARAQSFGGVEALCEQATAAVEREYRIPRHLLEAISLAESGRWDSENRRSYAWPWTVTSGEEQWTLNSKSEAIRQVRSLQAQGRSNIDVGCMQINLHYHPDAFPTLEAAFDPLTNARYAGQFLRRNYQESRNWLTAAGNYHSNTDEYHNRYKLKVARFWNDRRGIGETQVASLQPGDVQQPRNGSTSPIDYERMARLNEAFQKRQAAYEAELNSQPGAISSNGGSMLTGDNYALDAQIKRIRQAAERKQRVQDLIRSERVPLAQPDINPDLQLWRNLYRSGPTDGPFLSAGTSQY